MLTTKFKVTVGTLLGLGVLGGLGYSQVQLQQEVNTLQAKPQVVKTIVVSPTTQPTATPTATFNRTYYVPSKTVAPKVTTTK